MIYKLTGKVEYVLPTGVVLDVNSVGYQIEMPLSDLCHIPAIGDNFSAWIYTLVREDALRLFGFFSLVQRNIFETLITINGVGPKVALAMLSTLEPTAIRNAAYEGRAEVFESVPGIGRRTAERILIELKPKLQRLMIGVGSPAKSTRSEAFDFGPDQVQQQVFEDLRSALENFGFKRKLVDPMIDKLAVEHAASDFKELMRVALIHLRPASKPEDQL